MEKENIFLWRRNKMEKEEKEKYNGEGKIVAVRVDRHVEGNLRLL